MRHRATLVPLVIFAIAYICFVTGICLKFEGYQTWMWLGVMHATVGFLCIPLAIDGL